MNLIFEFLLYRWKTKFASEYSNETLTKIKNCVQQSKQKLPFENQLDTLREIAKKDTRSIQVSDFGAGAKKMGEFRQIKRIYQQSTSSIRFQRLLNCLCKEFDFQNGLEMGTSLGFSTVYLSHGAKNGSITTIEACPQTAKEAQSLFQKLELTNVNLVNSTFREFFEIDNKHSFDFVFVDGHHDGKALLEYLESLKKNISQNAILILDDIRWSESMLGAWEKLKLDKDFSLQIDLFRMGILVFSNTRSMAIQRISL